MTTHRADDNALPAGGLNARWPRHEVNVSAYVQMAFPDDVELTGNIGEEMFLAHSHGTRWGIKVSGGVGPHALELQVGIRPLRPLKVKGEVLGQPISGLLKVTATALSFEGMAGQEAVHYGFNARGSSHNRGADLGMEVLYQAAYSQVIGEVRRIADAAMVALLLPVALRKWEAAYS